jgi:alkanesulfonate monooxygenase SsuD/methylene tetrahydromethanopterin reductase-like flavin-dependent oxidoreductase (luciferase family)
MTDPILRGGLDLPAAEEVRAPPHLGAACAPWHLPAQAADLDSVWMFDHFFNRRDDGSVQSMYESWTILSAVASITDRILLGTMVMCASFRNPGSSRRWPRRSTR